LRRLGAGGGVAVGKYGGVVAERKKEGSGEVGGGKGGSGWEEGRGGGGWGEGGRGVGG